MSADDILNPDDAKGYETLGPAYFAARRVVEDAMKPFDAEMLAPILKKAADDFYAKLQETVEDAIWGDAEINLQSKMWRMVDETVKALLTGEEWALSRYCLGSRYEHDKVRAAVAAHIPKEIQDARVSDLSAQVEWLTKELSYYRNLP